MATKEEWRDAKGYEGSYQVSNTGLVRSVDKIVRCRNGYALKKGRLLKYSHNLKGYRMLSVSVNGKTKTVTIHRLIATTFIPNPHKKTQINHINGIKTDNRVENLEWATASENALHAHANGLVSKFKSRPKKWIYIPLYNELLEISKT